MFNAFKKQTEKPKTNDENIAAFGKRLNAASVSFITTVTPYIYMRHDKKNLRDFISRVKIHATMESNAYEHYNEVLEEPYQEAIQNNPNQKEALKTFYDEVKELVREYDKSKKRINESESKPSTPKFK